MFTASSPARPTDWALRDYGTATWEGGDGECDHQSPDRQGATGERATRTTGHDDFYRDTCPKCGAVRVDKQLGLEPTPEEYIANMVEVFRGVWRVLRDDGTCWVNMGDGYAGSTQGGGDQSRRCDGGKQRLLQQRETQSQMKSPVVSGLKPKDLIGMPWRLALALQADGWYLRSAMPWVKRSAMPESCKDRPASALEYVFLFTKKPRYYFDMEAVRQAPSGITGGACFGGPLKDAKAEQKLGASLRTHHRAATKEDRERYANNGRAWRNGDLWFQSIEEPHGLVGVDDELVGLDVNPESFPGAHFATYPRRLVEPLVACGSSDKGCCPECGKAWVRVVEKPTPPSDVFTNCSHPGGELVNMPRRGGERVGSGQKLQAWRDAHPSTTLGWEPGCTCCPSDKRPEQVGLSPVPCTVLDIFHGSGTSAVVAKSLGRHYIGIELNPEYIDLSIPRLRAGAGGPKAAKPIQGQATFF